MESIKTIARHVAAALGVTLAMAGGAQAQNEVGTTFPPGFMILKDASTVDPKVPGSGTEWIGFGGSGQITRTPVIFLHGNGGTPFDAYNSTATGTCPKFGADIRRMAQYFYTQGGYSTSELWALGYLGSGCPNSMPELTFYNASEAHSINANVSDLRRFVQQVLSYTGASRVDIVAHDTGVVLVREWVRQDSARRLVRKFVAIDGPNQGMAICSTATGNPWATSGMGGFTPTSALCEELGSPNTPFLKTLNKAVDGQRISSPDTFVIRNGDSSFLFFPREDGLSVQGAPGINPNSDSVLDTYGTPTDFTTSASIPRNSNELVLTGQNGGDYFHGGTAHVGIANSEITWQAALAFIRKK